MSLLAKLQALRNRKAPRHCENPKCGKELVRKTTPNGKLEKLGRFNARRFCDINCRGAGCATHGMTGTPEYRIWHGMIRRCLDKNNPGYKDYGGRGITVCERWMKFENFYADMGPRTSPKHMLERKNNHLGYNPENCKWATRTEQMRNRRSVKLFWYEGKNRCLSEIAPMVGIKFATLYWRVILHGWTLDQALAKKNKKLIEFEGELQPISAVSKKTGIPIGALRHRVSKQRSAEKLFAPVGQSREDTVMVPWKGKQRTLRSVAKEIGVPFGTLYCRIFKHRWSVKRALTQPVRQRKTSGAQRA